MIETVPTYALPLRCANAGPDLLHTTVTEHETIARVLELERHLQDRRHSVAQQQPTTDDNLRVTKRPEFLPRLWTTRLDFAGRILIRGAPELLEQCAVKPHVSRVDGRVRLMRQLRPQLRPRAALLVLGACDKAGRARCLP